MPGIIIIDYLYYEWPTGPVAPPTPVPEVPNDEGFPFARKRLVEWSYGLTGSVKQKTSETLSLHGQALVHSTFKSELTGRVQNNVSLTIDGAGVCVHSTSASFEASGHLIQQVKSAFEASGYLIRTAELTSPLTGSCLKASSFTFTLNGRNMAVIWMADDDE